MSHEDEYERVEYEYEFELLNSVDGKVITLACTSNHELDPQQYAHALMSYAERILTVQSMSEIMSEVN